MHITTIMVVLILRLINLTAILVVLILRLAMGPKLRLTGWSSLVLLLEGLTDLIPSGLPS